MEPTEELSFHQQASLVLQEIDSGQDELVKLVKYNGVKPDVHIEVLRSLMNVRTALDEAKLWLGHSIEQHALRDDEMP